MGSKNSKGYDDNEASNGKNLNDATIHMVGILNSV